MKMELTGKETEAELLEMRNKELARIAKLRFIINEVKSLDCSQLPPAEREPIKRAIEHLKTTDYHLENDGLNSNLLGVENDNAINLSYTEKKVLQEHLMAQVRKKVHLLIEKRKATEGQDGKADISDAIKALEERRAQAAKKAVELRALKYKLLKRIVELKYGPHMSTKLDYILSVAMQNETKCKILHGFLNNHLLNRYEHAEQALGALEEFLQEDAEKKDLEK